MLDAEIKSSVEKVNHTAAMGRALAIDWGTGQIGLAISDEMCLTARSLPFLPRTNWKKTVHALKEICARYEVSLIVLGLPLQLDGQEGTAAQEVRRVARNLNLSLKLEVRLQDERLTSKDAEKSLHAQRLSDREINKRVDSEAAAIILMDFIS